MIRTHYHPTYTIARKITNAEGVFAYYWPISYRPTKDIYPSCPIWSEEY